MVDIQFKYNPNNVPRLSDAEIERHTAVIDNRLLEDGSEVIFRSTVMHECGHSVYHPEYYCIDYSALQTTQPTDVKHLPYTSCKGADILGSGITIGEKRKLKTAKDWLEHQAKYFSAASLMPKSSMRTLCKNASLQTYCFEKHPDFENDALIAAVAQKFNVSMASARIRVEGHITGRPLKRH